MLAKVQTGASPPQSNHKWFDHQAKDNR